jgi:hypothetical protein
VRVVAEGARRDDRVRGRGVHVGHGREDHVDARGPGLEAREQARVVGGRRLGAGRDGHRRRQRGRLAHLLAGATLEVGGHEQVAPRPQPQRRDQPVDPLDALAEDDRAARRVALDERDERLDRRGALAAAQRRPDHAADAAPEIVDARQAASIGSRRGPPSMPHRCDDGERSCVASPPVASMRRRIAAAPRCRASRDARRRRAPVAPRTTSRATHRARLGARRHRT